MQTLFDELGGEARLRVVIDSFVDRVVSDPMIGFLFRRVDRHRLKSKEYEFAAAHLGAALAYTGRPLREAHAPHAIQEGQFMRRLQLLREVLDDERVPDTVREHWIRHTESLQSVIVPEAGADCGPLRPEGGASL